MAKIVVTLLGPQADLPKGRTLECRECGTRLRDGQPHTARSPKPHQSLAALIIRAEDLEPVRPARPSKFYPKAEIPALDAVTDFYIERGEISEYVAGSHRGVTGWR
jgi:hypothetical protein